MTERIQNATVRLAGGIDRRRFLRRTANVLFAGVAVTSAGELFKPSTALAYTSSCTQPSSGSGCPYGCGPSKCCNASGRSSACNCGTGTTCKSGTAHCKGRAATWGGTSCWTCTHYVCGGSTMFRYVTTCCDCKTSGCGDSSGHCISYQTQVYKAGACATANRTAEAGSDELELVGIDTGDPATSWGVR
jgi:hypothetical protein